MSCSAYSVHAYFVLSLFFFPVRSFVHVLRYATHVALWPFLLEILSSSPAGSVRSGTQRDIPFFISSFLRLISPRLRSPPYKADSNYTRDTGNPTRVRSAGQLKNNRSSSGRPYAASILVSSSLFLFFRIPTTFPAGTCRDTSEESYKSRRWWRTESKKSGEVKRDTRWYPRAVKRLIDVDAGVD